MANRDPETTRELWENEGTFSRYRINLRGADNVPEPYRGSVEWRDHQGISGYYAVPFNFPSAGLVAVEFNFEHLCWVEVRWRRTDSQWEAFRLAAVDLCLDIRLIDLSEEEHRRLIPISESEEEGAAPEAQGAFSTHREHMTSPPSRTTQGHSIELPEAPEVMATQT